MEEVKRILYSLTRFCLWLFGDGRIQ